MSTPQTLTQTLPPHQHLGQQQRYLPSPTDRYLPPPRPSSNLSNGYHQNIPTRPSSNLSNRQLPPPPRPESGMSNTHYSHHAHSQSRGAEYSTYASGYTQHQQHPHDDGRRTESRSNYPPQQRQLPPLQQQQPHTASVSRASAAGAGAELHPTHSNRSVQSDSMERGRKRRGKSPVDWVKYFGGKPPAEIIEIHDDDSPAPPATVHPINPPTGNVSSSTQHSDKRRRVGGNAGEVPTYSTTNTPYSYSNGTSTESLQATTAPTSLGSTASSGSRLDATQTGQKRKRATRTTDAERKRQEVERAGPRGYLAEYGQYVPPKQIKKMKDVTVPQIHDVSDLKADRRIPTNLILSARSTLTRSTTRTATTLYRKTAALVNATTSVICSVRAPSARSFAQSTFDLARRSP